LETRTRKFNDPHGFENLFPGQSEVRRAAAGNDFAKLRALSKLSGEQSARIEELSIEISRLKLESVADQIGRLNRVISDINSLLQHLRGIEKSLPGRIKEINTDITLFNELRSKAETEGTDQFNSAGLVNVGATEWTDFIKAAKKFADAQHADYPHENDACLLCQQAISSDARSLLRSLWAFLDADHQAKLNSVQGSIEVNIKRIENLELGFFNDQSVTYRYLETNDPKLKIEVETFITGCREFIADALNQIGSSEIATAVFDLPSPTDSLEELIGSLTDRISALEEKDSTEELRKLESELLELQHRTVLKENWERISEYFNNIEWAKKAKRALGTTRHITQKHNELFQLLVTDRYVELFKETLRELNCPMNVSVSTRGRHVEVLRQILLESPTGGAKPENVLSEGEKRAVAIADFITEATLDDDCSVIVLDDPVTSLDHEWKETMAKRLVSESVKRQVVIFTHDRPFLSLIKRFAEENEIEYFSHSIERKFDDSPGYIHLNYSPDLVDDYKTVGKAIDLLVRARNAKTPEEAKFFLQQGFNALRTTYEAFIMLKLFNGVIRRFDPHIKVNKLKEIYIDENILDKVVEKFNRISRFTGGHLPSDQLEMEPVTPEGLDREIKEFKELENELKELKKQSKSN
jgi:ABC-type lipoprotein export system ATPase subunit